MLNVADPLAPAVEFSGHHSGSFYVKAAFSADDAFVASGSTDCNAYVWRVCVLLPRVLRAPPSAP